MENTKGLVNYTVRYNSDPRLISGNHKSGIIYLTDTDERSFNNISETLVFLSECTDPITKVEEIVPELRNCKKFNFLLPESHVKVKHQVTDHADDIKNSDLSWG